MRAFRYINSKVIPLDRANIDTDAIIPKQFLKSIKRSGFGVYLFDEWRYLDRGEPDMDCTHRPLNPDFILNKPSAFRARILLTRENFGCGSSREHAPWALQDYGFRVIIAPSFADIFFNNCFKNGLLVIVLPETQVNELFEATHAIPGFQVTIDLEVQVVKTPSGQTYQFDVDVFRKHCLLNGYDEIALTLRHADLIRQYEKKRLETQPWLARSL